MIKIIACVIVYRSTNGRSGYYIKYRCMAGDKGEEI